MVSRFDYAAQWQPYAHPGGFNDLDSVEVGNGSNDGISFSARQTVLSLWSLASSPLLLGSDPRYLAPEDLALLSNRAVLAVDQDGYRRSTDPKCAHRTGIRQARARRRCDRRSLQHQHDEFGEYLDRPPAIGLPTGCAAYALENLWSHNKTCHSRSDHRHCSPGRSRTIESDPALWLNLSIDL